MLAGRLNVRQFGVPQKADHEAIKELEGAVLRHAPQVHGYDLDGVLDVLNGLRNYDPRFCKVLLCSPISSLIVMSLASRDYKLHMVVA